MANIDGFILINKEKNWTSRDVCNKVRTTFHIDKVGHTGTLDPFATGLLIVSLGKGTKAGSYIENYEKEYVAELVLGKKTSTGDLNGEIVETKTIPNINEDDINNVFSSFLGEIDQIPPMASAIHYKGQRLYHLAHQGIEVDRPSRKVTIYELTLISFKDNVITFKAKVSKGTYLRTLGEDIAEKLNTVGYLCSLNRISVGNFKVENSNQILNINKDQIINVSEGLNQLHHVYVDEILVNKAKSGVILFFKNTPETILICDKENNAIALYEQIEDNKYKCIRGLW